MPGATDGFPVDMNQEYIFKSLQLVEPFDPNRVHNFDMKVNQFPQMKKMRSGQVRVFEKRMAEATPRIVDIPILLALVKTG